MTGQVTDPELAHVAALELALLDPRVRRSPDLVSALLDPDYREVGASGRAWDSESVLEVLAAEGHGSERGVPVAAASEVEAVAVSDGIALVTYVATSSRHVARRSALWRRDGEGGWRMLYAQGTVVPEVAGA